MTTPDLITTLTDLDDSDEWRDQAVCGGHTALFFARKAERPQARERREQKARRICSVCPVMAECRDHARRHHLYGMWGGESERDRHLAGYELNAPIGVPRGRGPESAAS